MSDVNRRYFEGLMADRKLSLRALAKRMGLGHSQLSLTFSGARKLQLDEAVQLASILSVPLAAVLDAAGVDAAMVDENRVPVIGSVSGDGTVTPTPDGVAERATAPCAIPPEAVAVQCRTAGSALAFADGWVFFLSRADHVTPACLGRFCLAQIEGGPMVVATLARGYRENTWNLSGFYQAESARLAWASPVLFTRN